MEPVELSLPLPGVSGLSADAPVSLYGKLYLPTSIDRRHARVVILGAGGSYDTHYWDLEVPKRGRWEYSAANYLREQGFLVLSLDHLGTGNSTLPPDGSQVSLDLMAQADHLATQAFLQQLQAGKLLQELPAFDRVGVVRFGHSMGAIIALIEQGMFPLYDGLGILGWGNLGFLMTEEEFEAMLSALTIERGYIDGKSARPLWQSLFYLQNVPEEVIEADTEVATTIPSKVMPVGDITKVTSAYARLIDVPVFLGFGEVDVTQATNKLEEVTVYEGARGKGITFFELPGSAHCHNFAPRREELWEMQARWVDMVLH